jgi:hypothetical protein
MDQTIAVANIQASLGATNVLLVGAALLPILPILFRRKLSSLVALAIVGAAGAVLYLGLASLPSAFLILAAGAALLSATSRHSYRLVRDLQQEQAAVLARLRSLEVGEGRLQAILARKPFINGPREQRANQLSGDNGARDYTHL